MTTFRLSLLFLGAAAGCTTTSRPPSGASVARDTIIRSTLDSATIERLCQQPDSVRAGRAECVLWDMREPLVRMTPPPPPPAPPPP